MAIHPGSGPVLDPRTTMELVESGPCGKHTHPEHRIFRRTDWINNSLELDQFNVEVLANDGVTVVSDSDRFLLSASILMYEKWEAPSEQLFVFHLVPT